jgi:hypothetical protein
MSIESQRWRLLLSHRPHMGSLSDWGRTYLSLRAESVSRRLWGSAGWRRRVPTKGASSTCVRIMNWVIFLSYFVMVCSHFSWWFWLKFLICCCNFSGMALDHVTVGTGRKSMLSMSKNLWQRRLRWLMRVHMCMIRQWKNDLLILVEIGREILILLKCNVGLVCLVLLEIWTCDLPSRDTP